MTTSRFRSIAIATLLCVVPLGCGQQNDAGANSELQTILKYDSTAQQNQQFQSFLDRRSKNRGQLEELLRSVGFHEVNSEQGCRVFERADKGATPTVLFCPDSVAGFVGPPEMSK
jgi:hypothetical protein